MMWNWRSTARMKFVRTLTCSRASCVMPTLQRAGFACSPEQHDHAHRRSAESVRRRTHGRGGMPSNNRTRRKNITAAGSKDVLASSVGLTQELSILPSAGSGPGWPQRSEVSDDKCPGGPKGETLERSAGFERCLCAGRLPPALLAQSSLCASAGCSSIRRPSVRWRTIATRRLCTLAYIHAIDFGLFCPDARDSPWQ